MSGDELMVTGIFLVGRKPGRAAGHDAGQSGAVAGSARKA
jgi:hypothetical protein